MTTALQDKIDKLHALRESEVDGLRRAGWDRVDAIDEADRRFGERFAALTDPATPPKETDRRKG